MSRKRPLTPVKQSRPTGWDYRPWLIAALAIVGFLPSWNGDFVFDDAESIVNNPIVTGKAPLASVLIADFWGRPIADASSHKSYRPLTTLTFWLNHSLHGLWSPGFHLVNLFLHAACSISLYRMVREVARILNAPDVSLPSAVAFAVHPVHSEAVANMTGRAELLMTLFFLEGVRCYCKHRCLLSRPSPPSLAFSLLCLASVISKEQGIMLAPVCMCVELLLSFPSLPSPRRLSLLVSLSLCLVIGRGWVNGWQSPRFSPVDNAAAFMDGRGWRAVNYCWVWVLNMHLLLSPTHMCVDWSMGCVPLIRSWSDPRIFSPLALLILTVLAWNILRAMERREKNLCLFAVSLSLLSFLPASNLLVTVGFTVAERVLYLPSAGYCLLLGLLFHHLPASKRVLVWGIVAVAVTMSWQRSLEWRTEVSLYSSGLRVCPSNAKLHYNLGKVLSDAGNKNAAEQQYAEAIRLNPFYPSALNNLASMWERAGRAPSAIPLLERAVSLQPSFAAGWLNLGIARMRTGEWELAHSSLLRALSLRPNHADTVYNMGNLHLAQGDRETAIGCWRNATRLDPVHSAAWTNLLVALDESDLCGEAVEEGRQVVKRLPLFAAAHFQLGSCLGKMNRFDEAEWHLREALRINPKNSIYHANLGVLYERWGRVSMATSLYRSALGLDGSLDGMRDRLDRLEGRMGRVVGGGERNSSKWGR